MSRCTRPTASSLGAWFVPAAGSADTGMAVLVVPGNGGNRVDRAEFAEGARRRGLAVLLVDYRGYGGNPGTPSEDGLAADADAAVGALTELGYPPDRTVYFGESLGSGVVAALQVRHPPAGVVLRSPFTELADVGAHHYPWLPVRALLRDRFPVVVAPRCKRRAGDRHLRRRRLRGPDRAQRSGRGPCPLVGRAGGPPGRRSQRPRHVRTTGGRRGRPAGARRELTYIIEVLTMSDPDQLGCRYALLAGECNNALHDRECNTADEAALQTEHRITRVRSAPDRRARPRRLHDGRAGRGGRRVPAHAVQLLPQQDRRRPGQPRRTIPASRPRRPSGAAGRTVTWSRTSASWHTRCSSTPRSLAREEMERRRRLVHHQPTAHHGRPRALRAAHRRSSST